MVTNLQFLRELFNLCDELEQLSNKSELKVMMNYYHNMFLNTCWKAFFGFTINFLIIVTFIF